MRTHRLKWVREIVDEYENGNNLAADVAMNRISAVLAPQHGTFAGYTNDGCRCEECRGANAKVQLRWRREKEKCG